MSERKRAVFFMDMQDGIPVCPDCKVQVGEGEDHCINCALSESEFEIEGLRKYAAHKKGCFRAKSVFRVIRCSCGLDDLLAG